MTWLEGILVDDNNNTLALSQLFRLNYVHDRLTLFARVHSLALS